MRCAVLGDPIAHSLSPVLHTAAYAALGLDWTYEAVRVPAGGLQDFFATLGSGSGAGEWRGLSLTMPLKREVLPLLDEADDRVRLTGAANTVVLHRGADGVRTHGANTDVTGARACLGAWDATPRTAVVLGGGATATSMLTALAESGLTEAVLAVRDPGRAGPTLDAVARHPAAPRVQVVALDAVSVAAACADAEVLVSTVPAAAQADDLVESTAAVPLVFDVVYDPWPTPLAAAAERRGQGLISGLDLLIAQAVDQVVLMTGRDGVPATAMRLAAERELAARARR